MRPRYRRNGFQKPISRNQILSATLYPFLALSYYIMIGLLMQSWHRFLLLFLPHFLFFLLSCSFWYAVETIDPIEISGQTTQSLICFKSSKVQTRYCPNCRKSVEGLDHHCVWLNTCIGSKNYLPFLGLVVCGFLQMGWQLIVTLFYMTLWFDDHLKAQIASYLPTKFYLLLLSLLCLASGLVGLMFTTILAFHLYLLLWARMGTYAWLLSRGDPSKSEDSFSENKKTYLANELARHQKQQAWVQSLSKTLPPENPQTLPPGTAKALLPLSAQNSPPLVLSSLSEDLECGGKANETISSVLQSQNQRGEGDFQPTELTLQSNREADDTMIPSPHYGHSTVPAATAVEGGSGVFRSLYLKAAQIFPGQSDSPQHLPPHPEVSYHSIVSQSHQESLHSNLDAATLPPPTGGAL